MTSLQRREGALEPFHLFDRLDRLFDQWIQSMPGRMPLAAGWDRTTNEVIRVDEYRDDATLVVRAELAGIDPDKDVELTVADGMLRINARRQVEEKSKDKGYFRHEMRYGSFTRTLPVPEGVSETDITATYKDGILEIRVPLPEQPAASQPTKIAITKG